jgi:hypothetical protein
MGNSLRVVGATAVAAVAVVAAGCGGSSSPSAAPATTATTTTATTPGTGANSTARAAFNACLTQHGVKVPARTGRPPGGGTGSGQPPAGGPGGGGFANLTAAQRQAFTACRSKLPAGAGPGGRGGGRASNPAFAKYNACLKKNGVTLGASNNQKTFAKAQAACAKLAPTGGPGGGTPNSAGGTSLQ